MFKRLFTAAALALLLAAPAWAKGALPAEPSNFTLEVALATAMRNNPDITAAESKLRQAQLEKEQQDLWWAKTLRANVNYNVLGTQGGGQAVTTDGTVLPAAAIGFNVNLGDVLAGPKQSARAVEDVRIAEAELRKTTLAVATQVTAAYQEYQAAKQVAGMSEDMLAAADTDLRVIERTFARGLAGANQLVGARLAVQRVRADQVQVSGNVVKAWTNLLNAMGDPAWIPGANAPNGTNAAGAAERR
jgi:outer membrane protein TolC